MINNTLQAQFAPSASMRIIDPVLYAQIAAQYGFGVNIIFGVSPVSLAAQYGINWVNNPTASDYNNLPCVFTVDAASQVLGTLIDPAANGVQTLAGQSYTDPNGQLFSEVTWEWQVEVQLYSVQDGGKFECEIVSWTGDGTSNRTIPTTLDLTAGVAAVWGCGGANGLGTDEANFFRHNNISMGGTAVCSIGSDPLANGIVGFTSSGFQVSPGVSSLNYGNTNGVPYTALVCLDTSFDNRFMQCGTYTGLGGGALATLVAQGSSVVTYSSGIHFDPSMSGLTVTDPSANNYTFTYVSPTSGTISPAYIPIVSNPTALSFVNTGRNISVVTSEDNAAVQLTHLWVWGSGVAYKSVDIAGATSVDLQSGPNNAAPINTMITGLNVGSFSIVEAASPNQSVNTVSHKYDYMALCVDATFAAANVFTSGQRSTPGSLPDTATGLPFQPALIFGRQGSTGTPTSGGIFRGPQHATDNSTAMALPSGSNNVGSNGFASITADGFTANGAIAHTSGQPYWYWAWLGGDTGAAPIVEVPTWSMTDPLDLGTGDPSNIQTSVQQQTTPGPEWTQEPPDSPAAQWWCFTQFGLSVFQIDSPGPGWVACSGPATDAGWYLSTAAFANQDTIVSGGRPANPRSWTDIKDWAVGNRTVFGGSPSAGANVNNKFIYPASSYTVGTENPPIRLFDGRSDKEMARLASTGANAIPKAVLSMLAANGTVYLSSWDAGTSSSTWSGRVFQLDPDTGVQTVLGAAFADGEMPYALCWHMGRLWCGTTNGIGTVGKVYYFRPGIDTAWTLDHTPSADSLGGVTCMASYKGTLYVGTENAAAGRGSILARSPLAVWSTSHAGTGGTAKVNNGYLALTVLGANLYASYWNNDTTPVSKIEKFDGSSWTTAYTGTGATLVPFILLWLDNEELYAVGGSRPYDAVLLVTSTGTSWTDLTPELPNETATLLPLFGAVVT